MASICLRRIRGLGWRRMGEMVESTDQGPADFFSFGIVFLGCLIGAAGVVTVCVFTALCGLALMTLGMLYFLLAD